MMNYTVDGMYYTANDGYVFKIKGEDSIMAKTLRLRNPEMLDNYEIIPEPIPEEPEQEEIAEDGEV
jgi:hypothetical protein